MKKRWVVMALCVWPLGAAPSSVVLNGGNVRVQVAAGTSHWFSYQVGAGPALHPRGPALEIDGRWMQPRIASAHLAGSPKRLPMGVDEYRVEAEMAGEPGLSATLVFRISARNPTMRFRYELHDRKGRRLTRVSGADRLEYTALSLAAATEVREVRFSEFQEATHSFTLSERTIAAKEFDNELRLMGPLLAARMEGQSLLVAYEHGSQAPDAFVAFQLDAYRNATVRAVKGNYYAGQSVDGWQSVWLHMAAAPGSIDDLAAIYRQFILRDLSESTASREPYIFYNTWNFQERNKWWYQHPYLESMNESRMLGEMDVAHRMGIDVFVMDTGWYEKTGDWQVSPARFPHGIEPIRRRLESYGMKLGLWFNPTAAAVSSRMAQEQSSAIVEHNGRPGGAFPVWETENSHPMCLVSSYADAFARKLIQVARETGARYFKWDAIGQYGCDSPNHLHGTDANTRQERADSYAFQLPFFMTRVVERLQQEVPDAIVDFDITEGGRAVGLSFLSAGKYFLINNGPYKQNYDLPIDLANENWNLFFWPGPARTWICRTPLTFDKWLPSVLFLTHYFPDDPVASQEVNVASLLLGQNGIWGDLPRVSAERVRYIGDALRHYKQVRADVTAASPVRSGGVGGTPEVHEKIAANGRGLVAVFSTAPGDIDYVTSAKVDRPYWQTGHAKAEATFDAAGRAHLRIHFERPGAVVMLFGADD